MVGYRYDDLMKSHLGLLGPYQLLLITLVSLDPVTYALYTLCPVFIASTPPHTCNLSPVPHNCTQEEWRAWGIPQICPQGEPCTPDPCKVYQTNNVSGFINCSHGGGPGWSEELQTESCSSWTYGESFYSDSAVKEWDLVCERRGLGNTISGAYMLGRCLGCLLLGFVADKFGRRRAMLAMTALTFACALAMAFVTNVYVFLVLRFLIATFDMARSNVGFILGVEYLHSSKRVFFTGVWGDFWVFGSLLLAGLAYVIPQWRHLLLASALPEILIFTVHYLFLPESPRWLLLEERKEEAKKFIKKMAKFNKKDLPEEWDLLAEESVTQASFLDLLRSPQLALMTVIMAYIFFANSFVYYGLTLNTSNLAGDEYLNFFISGAVEFPAYTLIAIFYDHRQRRPPYCFCMLAGGLLLLSTTCVPKDVGWLVAVLSMTGKFFITASFIMTWLVVAEVFPTAVRGVALGVTNGAARLAAFLSAYVNLLRTVLAPLPAIIFSTVAIVAGLLLLAVPETHGTVLPQTVPEGEAFIRENLCRVGSCRRKKSTDIEEEEHLKAMNC